jgi:murein DD-endopeptidase MepM/ murein hydrolase activator NlpD
MKNSIPKALFSSALALAMMFWAGCESSRFGSEDSQARTASASYRYFFQDTVSNSSTQKWTAENLSGAKYWLLSNTYYSSPKAWVLGMNYWNNEHDRLTSIPISIPANTQGLRLAFYSRWHIQANDFGYVEISTNNGSTWTTLDTFSGASNSDYPGWTKYSYSLASTGGSTANYKVRFRFTSNATGTAWGLGIDSVSLYQKNISAPLNLAASDGSFTDKVRLTWSHNSDGTAPDGYRVYRSTADNGTYDFLTNVGYVTTWDDTSVDQGATYWYKLKGYRSGYLDGPYSTANSGYSSQPLNAPTGLTASDGTFGDRIRVQWTHSTGTQPDGYRIYRATSQNGSYFHQADTAYVTQWDDVGVPTNVPYWYKAVAYKSGYSDSGYSNADDGVAQSSGGSLNAPTNVAASDGTSSSQITVSWTHSTGTQPDGYRVFRSTAQNGTYSEVGTPGYTTSWSDTSVPTIGVYWYKVKARKSGSSDSDFSNEDQGYKSISMSSGLSFRFPVGTAADASGYYDANRFEDDSAAGRHLGNDWNGNGGGNSDLGDDVFAAAAGTVAKSWNAGGGWGNTIILDHVLYGGVHMQTMYSHLNARFVSDGQTVAKGDHIGDIGTNFGQYSAHLHFETRWGSSLVPGPGYGICSPQGHHGPAPQYQFDGTDFLENNQNPTSGTVLFADNFNLYSGDSNDTNDPWWYGAFDGYEYPGGGWGNGSPGEGPANASFSRRFRSFNYSGSDPGAYWARATGWGDTAGCLDQSINGNYSNNENDTAESCSIWVPGGTSVLVLRFTERYQIKSGDVCYVDAAYDDATWTNGLAEYSGDNNGAASYWSPRQVQLDAAQSAGGYIKVRFRFVSNNDGQTDLGWQVDNIRLLAN